MSEVKWESMLCTEVRVNIWNQFWKQSYFVEALSQQLIHEGCPRIIFPSYTMTTIRVTEASGTDLEVSASLSNSLCFKDTQFSHFCKLLQKLHWTRECWLGPRTALQMRNWWMSRLYQSQEGPAQRGGPLAAGLQELWLTVLPAGMAVETEIICEPVEMVLSNNFVTAAYAAVASERRRDAGGQDQR